MDDMYSIIYNTCDKYEPLWSGFFTLLNKYWPNCNRNIVFNTEKKEFTFDGFSICRPIIQENASWSQRLINALDKVNTPFVITILDDFYIKSPVREDIIKTCIDRMRKDPSIKCYTFAWQPGPNKPDVFQKEFEIRGRFARYRINAQIALWRVDYLRSILRTYENPWQFEINGSFRSTICGGKILALKKNAPLVFDYDYGFLIIRGKLNRELASYFSEKEGLDMNLPFEYYEKEVERKGGIRALRLGKYLIDMIVSVFRK